MTDTYSKVIADLLDKSKSIVNTKPNESLSLCKKALDISIEHSLKIEEAYSYLGMAHVHRTNSEPSSMLEVLFKAMNIFENENESIGLIRSLNLIGVAYFYSSMYDKAIGNFLEGLKLLDNFDDDNLKLSLLNNIGEVYRESGKYKQAEEFYNTAIELCDKNNILHSKAIINGNIGEIYFAEKDYKKALEFFILSYNELLNIDDEISLGEVENRIGKIYHVLGNNELALKYFNSAYDRLEHIDNKYFVIDVLINIGQLNINNEGSLKYFEKACRYSEVINAKKKHWEALLSLANYYEQMGNHKLALEVYKEHTRLDKEITASELGKKLEILNVELKYIEETKHLEKMKDVLKAELEIQKNELDNIRSINLELEKKAYEDDLTKIPNRRSINLYLNELLGKKGKTYSSCVLIIDIDFFKRYNDYWGHAEGDICLRKIADIISSHKFSEEDMFGRYGGEEFMYISNTMNSVEISNFAENLRVAIKNQDLYYYYKNDRYSITISIGGIFGSLNEYNSFKDVMEEADLELYKAKDGGRNLVRIKFI